MANRLQRVRRTARGGLRTVVSPKGMVGAAVEAAWTATHLVMYPFGFRAERAGGRTARYTLTGLPPVQRGLIISNVEAAGTPILLIHGFIDNRSIFTLLRRGLHRRGFGRVSTMNYSVLRGDVRSLAGRLAMRVEQLCAETGYERVHIVGHSLGGIIARYYVQCLGGDSRVHTVVTLGTPHQGTNAARLLPGHPIARQLTPGSDVMQELAATARGCRTRFVSFWSDLDALMVPKRHARLDHPDLAVRNVFVRGVAHLSLPINGKIVHEICSTLAHLDTDGGTLARGVTSIASSGPAPVPDRRRTFVNDRSVSDVR